MIKDDEKAYYMAYFKQKIKMLFFMHTFARFDDDNG